MTLQKGYDIISQIPNKSFSEIFNGQDLSDIIKNKGKTGQLLETIILKLNLSNTKLDFIDGELKTNKCKANGEPSETVAVCQISSHFDEMIDDNFNFNNNYIIDKISNMIYVRVDKSNSNPANWKFLPPQHICIKNKKYIFWYDKIKEDLKEICQYMQQICKNNQMLHTTKGSGHYIQIRTKDTAPYHPIYSNTYNKIVSDKNFAIYITKDGLNELIKLNME